MLKRTNSFRRQLKKRDSSLLNVLSATGSPFRRVWRHQGKKWVERFAVMHGESLCLLKKEQDWTPFRAFPEVLFVCTGASVQRVPACDGRDHCLLIEAPKMKVGADGSVTNTPSAPLLLSLESEEAMVGWEGALASAARHAAGSTPAAAAASEETHAATEAAQAAAKDAEAASELQRRLLEHACTERLAASERRAALEEELTELQAVAARQVSSLRD